MPFPLAPAGARRILGGCRRSGWFWCRGRSCRWCSRRMTKQSSPAGSGRGRRGPVRKGYKVIALLLMPSLGLFGLVGRQRVLLPRVCQRLPDCTRGSPHCSAHPGTLWCWLSSRFRRCEVAWCGPHLKPHQSRKFCFHYSGHDPVIRGNPDLHFEGACNGPVVITWIGREHGLYSCASPISLVEHCVTFRYDRRLLSLLGFLHNWPTSRWSATKKENRFSLNGNGIVSFLGRQFYRSTLNMICKHVL